jgi:hypothetical protein
MIKVTLAYHYQIYLQLLGIIYTIAHYHLLHYVEFWVLSKISGPPNLPQNWALLQIHMQERQGKL